MATPTENAPELPKYAVLISSRAGLDIDDAFMWMLATTEESIAIEWRDNLFEEIATLATLPHRQPIARENDIFSEEMRQMVYRRRTGAVAYRILFTINESVEDTPYIRIIHVRHGSARTMTKREAKEIEAERNKRHIL